MTVRDKEAIQRMLGKLEGVAFVADDKTSAVILDALEVIDSILNKYEEDGAE
jgi:hypothetical protein